MRSMTRVIRIATAAVLALAVGALPIVAEQCAESCEAHRAAATSAPSCHHAAPATARIGHLPIPCGHDHHPVAVSTATTALASNTSHSFPIVALATEFEPSMVRFVVTAGRADPTVSPPHASLPLALASALRI